MEGMDGEGGRGVDGGNGWREWMEGWREWMEGRREGWSVGRRERAIEGGKEVGSGELKGERRVGMELRGRDKKRR